MKTKKMRLKKAKVGIGLAGMKVAIRDLRKKYGPMLKRLAG